jgi:hypothetical protein
LKELDELIHKNWKKKYSNSAGKRRLEEMNEIERALTPEKFGLGRESCGKFTIDMSKSKDNSKMSTDFYVEYFKMLQQV